MSVIFYFELLFIIISLINVVKNKMTNPPIKEWDKELSGYFSTHNISNYINIERKQCPINDSYYLFVMKTILKFDDKINNEVETLGYTGFCLKDHNITPIEHTFINYYYIWDKSNMNSSSLVEIKKLPEKNPEKSENFKFFGACILSYFFFIIIVTIFPKKIVDKYNLKEYERVRKEREEEEEDNISDSNNINNINNDDYNSFNIKNEEDKPPADIIPDIASDKNYDLSENYSRSYRKLSNEKKREKEKENKPLIKEVNLYNELFLNKTNKAKLWNSFNIFNNITLLCEFSSLRKINKLKPIEIEIIIMETFKCLSYLILMYYTCLPIIELLPLNQPENVYKVLKEPYFIVLFRADYFYNTLFLIQGIYISYFYLFNSKNYCLTYILFEILYKIIPLYVLISVLYYIFNNSDIFLSNPLAKYFYEKEHANCECQAINIFLLIANFTYGAKEKFFPFCLYHFWYVFTWIQYYIIGMFLLLCYINFKSFFYVIYITIYFISFLLRLISLNIYTNPFSVFDLIQRNLKTYFQRSGLKIFTRAGPFLFGFLFGIYYYENKNSKQSLLTLFKENNGKLLFFSFIFLIFNFVFLTNMNKINSEHYLSIILVYLFKLFTHDIFILGILGLLIYFFINIEKAAKIFRLFNNHIFLLLKKLSFTAYLVMSILARVFFYSIEQPFNLNFKKIITYVFGGLFINLIISFILNIIFVLPLQRVSSIIKSTYIKNMED